ncbi:MAG: D-methionine transport system ATP-binding protein [Clostridia bacterium]|jgi:D-methionine transport system ATP-binding protein|nr:D-methionine transport system ATP-binding protein [Clostridia bacterium]MDN5321588.1 D-methionine transport system ATP-binding protein [Clostridia bacterium]
MIEITNLYKTYHSTEGNVEALKGINLKVEKGEIFGVIGFSGAGKSSLIRCVNMLEKPTSGSVVVNGLEMTQLTGQNLRNARKKIGMIFQHFNLLESCTVFENVAVALELSNTPKQVITEKVNNLLSIVGLADKKNNYPSQLSGGQKQRVAIARALANDIEVLLCDEATSALDPQTTNAILDLLLDINKKFQITILLITHEMHVIKKICDKVAVIENGQIIEEDTVLNVFTNPKNQTTKNFIKSIMEEDLPESVLKKLQKEDRNSNILKLTFVGCNAAQPVLARIAKELPVWPNILSGNIIQIKDQTLGRLIIELAGDSNSIEAGIQILKEQNVLTEVLNYD